MLTFLKTAAVIFVMTLIIPLAVWAGSGSWRSGLYAFKRYMQLMGGLFGAGLVIAGIFWFATLGTS
jgi:hypothetical protein